MHFFFFYRNLHTGYVTYPASSKGGRKSNAKLQRPSLGTSEA
jgi:hypothetical protein